MCGWATTLRRKKTPHRKSRIAYSGGIDFHAERLVNNETRPVYESCQNRCNLFTRMEMECLQFVDTTAKKF